MHINELNDGELTFTHQDEKTGEYTIFAVARLAQWIEDNKAVVTKVIFPLDYAFAKFVLENRGIELHRLNRCDTSYPIILLEMPDKTHLIVDGNHRYVKACLQGMLDLRAYMLPERLWRPFVVEGVSDVTAKASLILDSGIE